MIDILCTHITPADDRQDDPEFDDGTGPFIAPDPAMDHSWGVFCYDLDKGPHSATLYATRSAKQSAATVARGCNGKPFNVRFFFVVRPIKVIDGRYVEEPGLHHVVTPSGDYKYSIKA